MVSAFFFICGTYTFWLVSRNKGCVYCGVLISLALAFVLNALSLHDYFYIWNISLFLFWDLDTS